MRSCYDLRAKAAGDSASGLGAPTRRTRLLDTYLMNMPKGASEVRAMIVEDIRYMRDLGADRQATDLDAVLQSFLSRFPEAQPRAGQGAGGGRCGGAFFLMA